MSSIVCLASLAGALLSPQQATQSGSPLPAAETLLQRSQDGTAIIEHYGFEEVRIRVETPQPAVLILLDAFEKGWKAFLDTGAEIPILRANAVARAVVIPAGSHVVTFRYETPFLPIGATASCVGVLLCLGLIAHARWRIRRTGPPA